MICGGVALATVASCAALSNVQSIAPLMATVMSNAIPIADTLVELADIIFFSSFKPLWPVEENVGVAAPQCTRIATTCRMVRGTEGIRVPTE
jgi:hypothetical protein